jgi:hypothetical protein
MKKILRFIEFASFFISFISSPGCKADKPHTLPSLETLNVTEITQTTAKSGGNIISDGGEEIKGKGVCWNINANPTIDNFKTNDGTGDDNFESLLLNLEAGETYYLRAYAINDLGISYGDERSFTTADTQSEGQIIADHRIVSDFAKIPADYITLVKKMMVWFPGESHAGGYRNGMMLLEALNSTYDSNVGWGFPAPGDVIGLRFACWPTEGLGEQYWYTWKAYESGSLPAASTTIKNYISTNASAGKPISALGFVWCYDMVHQHGPTTAVDPVYGVHWYGTSVGGPDGDIPWGLDAADYIVTANRVSMDTYLAAMEDYISYCTNNSFLTKVIFTTGPVDTYSGEGGYQAYMKNQYIRNYVAANPSRILFDYADILCYDNNGIQTTTSWNGHTYPIITAINVTPMQEYHISEAGALRLGKALWWLLARITGWDGN